MRPTRIWPGELSRLPFIVVVNETRTLQRCEAVLAWLAGLVTRSAAAAPMAAGPFGTGASRRSTGSAKSRKCSEKSFPTTSEAKTASPSLRGVGEISRILRAFWMLHSWLHSNDEQLAPRITFFAVLIYEYVGYTIIIMIYKKYTHRHSKS